MMVLPPLTQPSIAILDIALTSGEMPYLTTAASSGLCRESKGPVTPVQGSADGSYTSQPFVHLMLQSVNNCYIGCWPRGLELDAKFSDWSVQPFSYCYQA